MQFLRRYHQLPYLRKSSISKQHALCVGNTVSLPLDRAIFQIYGSNTDVGKTIVSTGLCQSIATHQDYANVRYIKPLQTGGWDMSDAAFVKKYCADIQTSTLYLWDQPVSPHLAVQHSETIPSNQDIVEKLQSAIAETQSNEFIVIETAGGVLTPSPQCTPQLDLYRPFRFPVVLVGDGKLGGISATLSAIESLQLRGIDIAALAIIENPGEKLENHHAIQQQLQTTGLNIPIVAFDALPPTEEPLDEWYQNHAALFQSLHHQLNSFSLAQKTRLDSLKNDATDVVWWPFTQHKDYPKEKVTVIDSAYGDTFCTYSKDKDALVPMYDACASWWTQGIGHGNPHMASTLAYTASRYGHVMFPDNAHEPAVQLSKRLIDGVGKDWASKVFFSDDGSTAVEVAIKMAFRKYLVDHKLPLDNFHTNSDGSVSDQTQLVVLAQQDCYHGDTLGVMQVAEPSVFNSRQHAWFRKDAACLMDVPTIGIQDGAYQLTLPSSIESFVAQVKLDRQFETKSAIWDMEGRDTSAITAIYREYIHDILTKYQNEKVKFGALLLEPVLMGAGGMIWVDPLFQRVVVQECKKARIPVIYDEVFCGFWRLGVESARELLQENPDIGCYAKLLTGGVVPLSVTLGSQAVFDAFKTSTTKADALLHGHSFTANPVGCAASIWSIDQYDAFVAPKRCPGSSQLPDSIYWNEERVKQLSCYSNIQRTSSLGTVLILEFQSSSKGYADASSDATKLLEELRDHGVFARILGNVIYIMCTPLTSTKQCDQLLTQLEASLERIHSDPALQVEV